MFNYLMYIYLTIQTYDVKTKHHMFSVKLLHISLICYITMKFQLPLIYLRIV